MQRASLFDSAGNCLASITGTYFVGFREKNAYQGIYTASIVTSPENLFDHDTGIYVTGNTFSNFLENDFDNGNSFSHPYWWWWPANYSNRGINWERTAHIAIFDNYQKMILSQKCGIRIKGGGSRGKLPKSIACYARNIYDNSNHFDTNIFQTDIFPHKFVLFGGGDDNRFKLKDYLANVMEQNLHFATMDFIPCAMFLNGEYWGMYFITEDYNADYIHDHYQVDSANVIMIKNNILTTVSNQEDYQKYTDMLAFIEKNDMSDSANYNQACNLIDINSFIDYYAAQIYIGRCNDWPGNNFALWRVRNNDGSRYGDEKWRWMLFDVNSGGLSSNFLFDDTLSYVLTVDNVFSALYKNENFRRQFAERLLYIGNEVFAPENCNLFLEQYSQSLKEPIAADNLRFYMDFQYDEFDQNITDMRIFFEQRYDVIWNCLVNNLGEEWLAQSGLQK